MIVDGQYPNCPNVRCDAHGTVPSAVISTQCGEVEERKTASNERDASWTCDRLYANFAGTRRSISVPASGLLQISRCPPSFFARSRSPMRPKCPGRSAGVQHGRADSSSIVTDSEVKGGFAIGDFDFDIVRARVPERIAECLADDHQSLLTHYRMQVPGSALNAHLALDWVQLRQLFALRRERLRQNPSPHEAAGRRSFTLSRLSSSSLSARSSDCSISWRAGWSGGMRFASD